MNALQLLQDLDYRHKRETYKNVPPHAIARPRLNDKTANGLTQCILRWLTLHGHWCTRVNTTGRMLKGAQVVDVIGRTRVMAGKWIPGTTRKGTADIHGSINGKHVSIEVKIGRDTMSTYQHKTKQAIESSGGLYFVAKSFDSFMQWYDKVTN